MEADRRRSLVAQTIRVNVESQAHTLFNRIAPLALLEDLSNRTNIDPKARQQLRDAHLSYETFAVSFLLSAGRSVEHYFRPADLESQLSWIACHTLSSEGPLGLEIAPTGGFAFLDKAQQYDAYTVLWNLCHNACKLGRASATTTMENGFPVVSITSQGIMPREWVAYLEGKGPCPEGKGRGLQHARRSIKAQRWSVRITTDSDATEVRVYFGPHPGGGQ